MAWRKIAWCEAPEAGYDHCPHEDDEGNREIECENCSLYATADEEYDPHEYDEPPYTRFSTYDY